MNFGTLFQKFTLDIRNARSFDEVEWNQGTVMVIVRHLRASRPKFFWDVFRDRATSTWKIRGGRGPLMTDSSFYLAPDSATSSLDLRSL